MRQTLTDSGQTSVWYYSSQQYRGGLDGSLFALPGGDVHAAVGGEFVHYTLDINKTSPNNTGPATTGSAYLHIPLKRSVTSAYANCSSRSCLRKCMFRGSTACQSIFRDATTIMRCRGHGQSQDRC